RRRHRDGRRPRERVRLGLHGVGRGTLLVGWSPVRLPGSPAARHDAARAAELTMRDEPDRTIGLLDQIADTALDGDYHVVRADRPQSREFNTVLTGAVIGLFALLVTLAVV